MRVRRNISAVALGIAIACGPIAVADETRPLAVSERRILDGAYLYLISPDYCDPALLASRLKGWVARLIQGHGIPEQPALDYLTREEPRLRLIADAAFNGRKGKELCRAIFALKDEAPELGGGAPAQ